MPETAEDPWVRAIANFRDVTRWIIAGIAGAVSLLVGTSPLTGLGALEPSEGRLWIAVAGGVVGLVAFAFPFRAAVRVLGSRFVDIQEVANGTDRRRTRLRREVDARIRHRLPPRFPTLSSLAEADANLRREIQRPGELSERGEIIDPVKRALYAELAPYVTLALNVARFEEVRILFDDLCRTLAICLPFVAVGFGTFAWAANPPKKEPAGQAKQTDIHATIDLNEHLRQAFDATKLEQCAVLSLSGGRLECAAEASAHIGVETKIYLAAPARPLDMMALLEDALRKAATAKATTQFSIDDLANLAADNFIESASRELGRKTVDYFFDTSGKHSQPGPPLMVIVEPHKQPQTKALEERVDIRPFETGSDRLPPRRLWETALVGLVRQEEAQECRVDVSGFADRRGSSAQNLYLSLRRADRVARYLLDLGVSRARLHISPRGAYGDRFETDHPDDLAVNRRVEVRLNCQLSN